MNPRVVWIAAFAIAALAGGEKVEAHVTYKDLDAPPALVTSTFSGAGIQDPCASVTTGCQSSNAFTRYGWLKGTEPQLGDSHQLTVNAEFWRFHLDTSQKVTINFIQVQPGLDPAFTLYAGLLPDMGHDDTPIDPTNPTDANGCAIASPADAFPGPHDYLPHDGYRDTATYATAGGLVDCRPSSPYLGQFDAFASWSMANFAGAWSRIQYVASVSATPFTGNDGDIHFEGDHGSAAGTGETLVIVLPAGDYTVAAGGEACSIATATCYSPRLYGTVTYTREPPDLDGGSGDGITTYTGDGGSDVLESSSASDGSMTGADLGAEPPGERSGQPTSGCGACVVVGERTQRARTGTIVTVALAIWLIGRRRPRTGSARASHAFDSTATDGGIEPRTSA